MLLIRILILFHHIFLTNNCSQNFPCQYTVHMEVLEALGFSHSQQPPLMSSTSSVCVQQENQYNFKNMIKHRLFQRLWQYLIWVNLFYNIPSIRILSGSVLKEEQILSRFDMFSRTFSYHMRGYRHVCLHWPGKRHYWPLTEYILPRDWLV